MDGADMDLIDLMQSWCAQSKYFARMCDKTRIPFTGWYTDVLEAYSSLWEVSRHDPRWGMHGHFHLGLLKGQTGRSLAVPGEYKREVMTITRNLTGRGVRNPAQVLTSVAAGSSTAPPMQLSLKQRKLIKRRAAQSQLLRHHTHAAPTTGRKMEMFVQYNYFFDCRTRVFWCR